MDIVSKAINEILKTNIKPGMILHYKNQKLRADEYIYAYYHAIETILGEKTSLIETVYSVAVYSDNAKLCTGKLMIDLPTKMVERKEGDFSYDSEEKSDTNTYHTRKLLAKINSNLKQCKGISLALISKDEDGAHHQNVLFIYEDSIGKITFAVYEPGGQVELDTLPLIEYIAEKYAKTYNVETRVISHEISCHYGMQSYYDQVGYCVMWSLLWLYIVFMLIQDERCTTEGAIDQAEHLIISYANRPGKDHGKFLYKIVVNFGMYIAQKHMEIMRKYETEKEYNTFIKYFEIYLDGAKEWRS
jgi:hypothetical protein